MATWGKKALPILLLPLTHTYTLAKVLTTHLFLLKLDPPLGYGRRDLRKQEGFLGGGSGKEPACQCRRHENSIPR